MALNRTLLSKAKLLLTKQDDTQSVIEYGSLEYRKDGTPVDSLYYSEYNRIAGRWTDTELPIEMVKKIILGTTQLKMNSKTGTLHEQAPAYRINDDIQ